jgi:nitric-oxide synthase, bacterial
MATCPHMTNTITLTADERGSTDWMKRRAAAFLADTELPGDRLARIAAAHRSIDATGTYELTEEERSYGCRIAWRDFEGCIRAGSWRSLVVLDMSAAELTVDAVYRACASHLRYGTNNGKIRPALTLFPPDRPGRPGPRIWNDQLVRYAGSRQPDDTVNGDPAMVRLTTAIRNLGWTGEVNEFAVLPLVVEIPASKPVWRHLPSGDVLEVHIRHPKYNWLSGLGLRWHATPAISKMRLSIGGVDFPCCFNGWYALTEPLENLAGAQRYNKLPVIARELGFDMSDPLWRDEAELVLLRAILYSYRADGVTIEDHHSVDNYHHHYLAKRRNEGRPARGNRDKLLMPASTVTMHLRTEVFDPPTVEPETGVEFYYPPDPWLVEP